MADQSDVETALETALIAALYPSGAFPAASIIGAPARVYRGWPLSDAMNTDMAAGTLNVTVFPLPTMRNTTRTLLQTASVTYGKVTLTAALAGAVVTLGGTISAGQVIGVACLGFGYAYRLLGTETLTIIAAALAAEIPGATSAGAVLTLPSDRRISASVVADATVSMEYGRVEQQFQVTLWCSNPVMRDTACASILPQIVAMSWLALPNNESGRIRLVSSMTTDKAENAGQFRRDLRLSVDYPVTLVSTQPCVLFGVGLTNANNAGAVATFGIQLPLGAIVVGPNNYVITDQAGTVLANPSV